MRFPGWVTGALVLTATLGAGVVLGTHLERRRHSESSVSATLPMEHMRRFLLDELELDSAQDQAVGAILDRHQAGVDSAWRGLHPRLMATLDSSLREVAALLRPDQLERFRRIIHARHPGVLQ
jgi:hypothetical protein